MVLIDMIKVCSVHYQYKCERQQYIQKNIHGFTVTQRVKITQRQMRDSD